MLTLFPVAYQLWKQARLGKGKLMKLVLLAFWITPILTITGSSSRASQLALAIQLMVMFRKSIFKFKPLILVAAMSLLLFQLLPDEQMERFRNIGEDRTSQQRLLYWGHGVDMIEKHPWLGIGYHNFPKYYEQRHWEDMLYSRAELPHNILIQVGTDSGFLGLVPFLGLIAIALSIGRRFARRPVCTDDPMLSSVAIGTAYGVLGYFIAGQFVSVAYYPFLWVSLAFLVASLNIMQKTSVDIKNK